MTAGLYLCNFTMESALFLMDAHGLLELLRDGDERLDFFGRAIGQDFVIILFEYRFDRRDVGAQDGVGGNLERFDNAYEALHSDIGFSKLDFADVRKADVALLGQLGLAHLQSNARFPDACADFSGTGHGTGLHYTIFSHLIVYTRYLSYILKHIDRFEHKLYTEYKDIYYM